MYKNISGVGGGVLGAAGGSVVASQLPVTGTHEVVTIALAAVAGLLTWGFAYMALRRYSR